jgi:hypothetical protein
MRMGLPSLFQRGLCVIAGNETIGQADLPDPAPGDDAAIEGSRVAVDAAVMGEGSPCPG